MKSISGRIDRLQAIRKKQRQDLLTVFYQGGSKRRLIDHEAIVEVFENWDEIVQIVADESNSESNSKLGALLSALVSED